MEIYNIQSYQGRNVYSHRPVVKMVLNFGELCKSPTKDINDFNRNLLDLFPGLYKHHCSLGYEGGFVERLNEGTYIPHVTEHLILELQGMMGYEVYFGRARVITDPSIYYLVYEFKNEICAIECGRAAIEIISCLVVNKPVDLNSILSNLRKITTESELGPSTRAIFDEALRRGIPVMRIGNESLLQLGYGKYSRLIEASLTDATNCITADIAGNKHLTKQILKDHHIPVPHGDIAYTLESAISIAELSGYPVVLKPLDGNQGKGVTLDIRNEVQLKSAYKEAAKFSKTVIVEKYIRGNDYRILVVGNKVSAVSERRSPKVQGDGIHTIRELVELENMNPLRGEDHEKPLTRLKLDNMAKQVLAQQGYDENCVPEAGKIIFLRYNGNLSTGGTARNCTHEIHPVNSEIVIKAVKAIGLDIAGVDMTTEDISKPIYETSGAIIEINAAPGLRMHLYPSEGEAVNVASDIVDMMFPEEYPSSIPIVSVTGTNGKTTTTRLIRYALSLTGRKVGMTSTSGIYIGNECILKGDNTGPISAKMVLTNRDVEAAVLETARGGIVKRGLGYDLADVGIIVNISEDHLGLDNINTLQDLAFVKALVVEAVKPNGYSVLNADDSMTAYLMGRAAGQMMLFSRNPHNPMLLGHMESGKKAVLVEEQQIYFFDGKNMHPLMRLSEIPITFDGLVECNIENSLAAAAALYALEVPQEIIKMAFMSFKPDMVQNPGRFNLFDMGDFRVMLDYSHNPAGYSAVGAFIRKMDQKRLVGVIGIPGDRQDKSIREVGEISAGIFDKIYVKEDRDLRGRQPGEVAGILQESVMNSNFKKENVQVICSELKALETAMLDAQPGDLIVLFYEEFEPAVELINRFKQELDQNQLKPELVIGDTMA